MNKFMAGLTLGMILTAAFFIVYNPLQKKDSAAFVHETKESFASDTVLKNPDTLYNQPSLQNKKNINRDSLVLFARSLLGTPYLYGSTDPSKGLDCSGFVTYVFNRFGLAVPRSSYDFEHLGTRRSLNTCKPGDLILFTGTDTLEAAIGHIGIVCDTLYNNPSFIHSSSGKANGVTITSMSNKFYQDRFISVIDILF